MLFVCWHGPKRIPVIFDLVLSSFFVFSPGFHYISSFSTLVKCVTESVDWPFSFGCDYKTSTDTLVALLHGIHTTFVTDLNEFTVHSGHDF